MQNSRTNYNLLREKSRARKHKIPTTKTLLAEERAKRHAIEVQLSEMNAQCAEQAQELDTLKDDSKNLNKKLGAIRLELNRIRESNLRRKRHEQQYRGELRASRDRYEELRSRLAWAESGGNVITQEEMKQEY